MISVNVPKLRGKIAERGLDMTSLSGKLGISRNTLALYLKNPGKMPYNIVDDMANILCDNADEAASIFFDANLRNK